MVMSALAANALAGHQLITLVLAAAPFAGEFHSGMPDLPNKSGAAEVLGNLPGPVTAVTNRADRTNDATLVMGGIHPSSLNCAGQARVANTAVQRVLV
jgi:hypothetical protein